MAETRPDQADWEGTRRLPMLIAAQIDILNALRWELAARNTPKGRPKPPKPEPIPRPGVKSNKRRIGRDPVNASEFDAWWDAKARERQGRTG